MTNQPDPNPSKFLESLAQAASQTESLDVTLEQVFNGLKKYGFKLTVDHKGMIEAIRANLKESQKDAQQVTGKLQQFQKLVQMSALLTSSLEVDRVLEEVIDTIINLTRAERAYLMMRDDETGELKVRAARNWDGANLDKTEVSFSRGIMNAALEKGQPILTTNAQMDSRFEAMQSVYTNVLRSIACVPLVLREKAIGVLYIDNRIRAGVFADDILPILNAFANQAAIAIENARLFERVKAELDQAHQQVQALKIQIDQSKVDSQISEITESDLFKKLEQVRRDRPTQTE